MQKKIRGKIVAGVQMVAEEIEPAEAVFEDEFMATDMMPDPLLAGYVY